MSEEQNINHHYGVCDNIGCSLLIVAVAILVGIGFYMYDRHKVIESDIARQATVGK